MNDPIRMHYETHPYPYFSYLASVRTCDTYALNVDTVWALANGSVPVSVNRRILIAGCGSFSPYPTSLANPDAEIVALDLSRANLRRARNHALLHGRRNIHYVQGDLLDATTAPGPFSLIDAYGVLHHLPDPLAGLKALERRLAAGGIVRIMVYSRQARQEEESIRRALRLLGVRDMNGLRRLTKRVKKGSRFSAYLENAPEARHPSGLADALLHPRVVTFTVDRLLQLCSDAGLRPLMFAHQGAASGVAEEVERLRKIEREGTLSSNFTLYLVRMNHHTPAPVELSRLVLNPALRPSVRMLQVGTPIVAPKLGRPNPPLDRSTRAFLRTFITPRPTALLDGEERKFAELFRQALFLVAIR
jgi:SAM-dependent methyltransferase